MRETGKQGTLATSAYAELRNDIITTSLVPGAKLHLRALCDRFDIGLSPVREALSRLASEGFVHQEDHRGFTVAPLSEADLESLVKARCWLNETGLRQSIAHGDAKWEEGVLLAFHRLSRTPRHTDHDSSDRNREWEEAHRTFHTSLLSASGSTWLTDFCEQLFDAAERYRHVARIAGAARGQNEEEHRLIMDATLARDADKAVDLLNGHYGRTAALVQKMLVQAGSSENAPRPVVASSTGRSRALRQSSPG